MTIEEVLKLLMQERYGQCQSASLEEWRRRLGGLVATAPLMDITDDERALILQMREWKDGIPDGALGQGRMSMVYLSLMAARAELYILALRHGHNDILERRERFLKLVSPHDIIKLVRGWEDLQHRIREEEFADLTGDDN